MSMRKKAAAPKTKPKINYHLSGPMESYCQCDVHSYDVNMSRYSRLAEKERALDDELYKTNLDMAALVNVILGHPCDTDDDKMVTLYEIDYLKRGLKLSKYLKLIPALESPVIIPIKEPKIEIGYGYRDPSFFRYSPAVRPLIDPCPPVSFSRTPANLTDYYKPMLGRTEYQDTVSKNGMGILKNRQQYMQPLPSSRRRFGETCL